MKRRAIFRGFTSLIALAALLASSCAKDDVVSNDKTYDEDDLVFVIATRVISATSGDEVAVLLTNETVDSGEITTIGNGTEISTLAGEWAFALNKDYCYSIKDAGSTDPVMVGQYYVSAADGRMKLGNSYIGDSYHIWGMWGDTFATVRHSGAYTETSKSVTVANTGGAEGGELQNGTYYAARATTAYYSAASPVSEVGYYPTDNYLGRYNSEFSNGEAAACVGFATSGDYVYASYATTGVGLFAINSEGYGWDSANNDYVAKGYGTIANTIGSTTAFTPLKGVPAPLTPGMTYIARYPIDGNFESTPTVFGTDMMSQAFSRTTGNPLSTVVDNDDDGYVYVFSPGTMRRYSNDLSSSADNTAIQYAGYDSDTAIYSDQMTSTLKVKTSNLGARVMRIKSGEAEFDSSFGTNGVYDFSQSMGNYTFSRVWHISGSKFLLRTIHTENLYNASHKTDVGDADFYIYDASSNTSTKVTGLPDPTTAFVGQGNTAIGEPCFVDGKAYIPMATNDSYPAIWVVDSSSASATKGLVVNCTLISAVSQMVAK